jgi:flavodoxin
MLCVISQRLVKADLSEEFDCLAIESKIWLKGYSDLLDIFDFCNECGEFDLPFAGFRLKQIWILQFEDLCLEFDS